MKETTKTKAKNSKDQQQKGFSLSFQEQFELKVRLQSQKRLWMALYQNENSQSYYEKVFTPQNMPNNIIQVYDSLAGIYQFISQNYEKDLSLGFDETLKTCWLMMKTTVGKRDKIYQLALQKIEHSQFIKKNGQIKTLQNEVNNNRELIQRYKQKELQLKLELQKEEEATKILKNNYETLEIELIKIRAKQQLEWRQRIQREDKLQKLKRQIVEIQFKISQKIDNVNSHFIQRRGRKRKQVQMLVDQISPGKDKIQKKTTSYNRSCMILNDKEQKINNQRSFCNQIRVQESKIKQKSFSQRINFNKNQQKLNKPTEVQNQDQLTSPKTIINEINAYISDQTCQRANGKLKEGNSQKINSHTSFDGAFPIPIQNKQISLESKLLKCFIYSNSIPNQSSSSQIRKNISHSASLISSKVSSSREDAFQTLIGEKVALNLSYSNNIDKYELIKTKDSQLVKRINNDQLFYYITNSNSISARQHFVAIIEQITFHDFNFGIRPSTALNIPPRQWHSEIICLAGCAKKIIVGTDYNNTQIQLKKGDVIVTVADMTLRKVEFYINKILVNQTKLIGEERDWYFFVDSATKGNTIRLV